MVNPNQKPNVTEIIVLADQRTGSTALCDYLYHNLDGWRVNGEVFMHRAPKSSDKNPVAHLHKLPRFCVWRTQNVDNPEQYICFLRSQVSPKIGIVYKITYDQFIKYYRIGKLDYTNTLFLHLKRKNILSKFLSRERMRISNEAHTVSEKFDNPKIYFSATKFLMYFTKMHLKYYLSIMIVRGLFRPHAIETISYENFSKEPYETLEGIFTRYQIQMNLNRSGNLKKISKTKNRDQIKNPYSARYILWLTRSSWMLDG
jgi:LPS sulfotransferase NodH